MGFGLNAIIPSPVNSRMDFDGFWANAIIPSPVNSRMDFDGFWAKRNNSVPSEQPNGF